VPREFHGAGPQVVTQYTRAQETMAQPPRWLDDEQQSAWRAHVGPTVKTGWALEYRLQDDARLSVIEYHALARL